MPEQSLNEVELSAILARVDRGESASMDLLFQTVYGELRSMAQKKLQFESPEITLQATALVNEAYLKLLPRRESVWEGREHLLAAAGEAMRRILVDHARGKSRVKRGGSKAENDALVMPRRVRVELSDAGPLRDDAELVELDDALAKLSSIDPVLSRVVTMRFFAGMSEVEIARVLHSSERTVRRQWTYARAWLAREMRPDEERTP